MRLKVFGYSQDEYLYLLSPEGLKTKYKTYKTAKENNVAS